MKHLSRILLLAFITFNLLLEITAQDTITADTARTDLDAWMENNQVQRARDRGPIYVETIKYFESDSNHLVVEPFNTASAALFFIIAIWFLYRYRKEKMQSPFILYAAIMLFIGGVSGTIYHAFRIWPVFMYVDGGTIGILMLSFTAWVVYKLTHKLWFSILAIPLGMGLIFMLIGFLIQSGIRFNPSLGYALMGVVVVIPLVIYLFKTKFRGGKFILLALLAFSIAVFSRAFDLRSTLPMGSHFLWHLSGALATIFMFLFVWGEEKIRLGSIKTIEQSFRPKGEI